MSDESVEKPTPLSFSYFLRAVSLWLGRKIRTRTLLKALRERPIAVCGRAGSYIVDPTFNDGTDASV